MIQFDNLCQEAPYLVFKDKYDKSYKAKQKNIELSVYVAVQPNANVWMETSMVW